MCMCDMNYAYACDKSCIFVTRIMHMVPLPVPVPVPVPVLVRVRKSEGDALVYIMPIS